MRGWILCGALTLFGVVASGAHADPCKAIPDSGKLPTYLAKGKAFSGPVVYVGDGDSLCVAVGPTPDKWVEVRIADFYAPELSSGSGRAAKAALTKLVLGKPVTCVTDYQSYDRVVAQCEVGLVSLGDLMRKAGVHEGGKAFKQ